MSDEYEEIGPDERSILGALAEDALTLFRAGLFLIVIYVTILSVTLRTGGVEYVLNTVDSPYTIFGVMFWMGSVSASVVTYRTARRLSLQDHYTQLGAIDDKYIVLNLATASVLGLLISVFSLIFGLLEGWGKTVYDPSASIGLTQSSLLVGISLIFVFGIGGILGAVDMIRKRWGPIREIVLPRHS